MKHVVMALAFGVSLTSCGGGGTSGVSGNNSTAVAPSLQNAPSPTKLGELGAKQAFCFSSYAPDDRKIHFDDNGNAVIFWCDSLGGVNRLNAATLSPLKKMVVAQGFVLPTTGGGSRLIVRAVGNQRFVVVHQLKNGEPGMVSQVVDFSGASPTATLPVNLPPNTTNGQLVKQASGALTFIVDVQAKPFPTLALGADVTAQVVAPSGISFAEKKGVRWVESLTPAFRTNAVSATIGRLNTTDNADLDMYISEMDLLTGVVAGTRRVSAQSFRATCTAPELRQFHVAIASLEPIAGWSQRDPLTGRCHLYSQGERISDPNSTTRYFAFSNKQAQQFAVWEEARVGNSQIVWSRRDPVTAQWSASAPIATDLTSLGLFGGISREAWPTGGENGTLVVAWESRKEFDRFNSSYDQYLVSKFVDGQWTHLRTTSEIYRVAINGKGQGVALTCGRSPIFNPSCDDDLFGAFSF